MRVCCVLLVAGLLPASLAVSARAVPDPASRQVSLQLKGVPFKRAIEQLCRAQGLNCAVAKDVPDLPITLNLQSSSAVGALRILVREAEAHYAGITLSRNGDLYEVRVVPLEEQGRQAVRPQPVDPRLARKVTFALHGAALRDVTLEQALRELIRVAAPEVPGLSLGWDGDVLILETRGPAAARRRI